MAEIGAFTTPELTISVPIDLREANVYLTFRQGGKVVLEKNESSFRVSEDSIIVPLNQEDTSNFRPGPITFQIRYVFPDGSSDVSSTMQTNVIETYKGGVLNYVQR